MPKGRVSAELTAEAVARINAAIDAIRAELPFVVTLSREERKALVKLGPKSVSFVEDTRRMVADHPGLVPADLDGPELLRDADLYKELGKFSGRLTELAEAVDDTRMVAGSEAMVVSLVLYSTFKQAAKVVPGLNDVMGEMGKRFKRSGNGKKAASDEGKAVGGSQSK